MMGKSSPFICPKSDDLTIITFNIFGKKKANSADG